jgi:ABC-type polysaccharide/polyol phosphate transport system ATPase subunit
MPAIRFLDVTKRFAVGEHPATAGELVAASLRGWLGGQGGGRKDRYTALDSVSFDVNAGEAVGVIGPNGAGKSTALKLLAGILRADRGEVICRGRKAALIEVGAGFHGDLTGRENIQLNGVLLGMSRREIRQKLDSIVAFAGIDRFLDTPVKRYSSGMYARLGFSIAAHVDPDVLLVDEVLSVGDAMFRVRCLERMRQLVCGGTALLFVTHDLEQMRAICGRALVLESGRLTFDGTASGAVAAYQRALSAGVARPADLVDGGECDSLCVERFIVRDGFGDEADCIRPDHFVRVELILRSPSSQAVAVEVNLRRMDAGENALSFNSARSGRMLELHPGPNRVLLDVPGIPLRGGAYVWNVRAWAAAKGNILLDSPFAFPMVIDDGGRATGSLSLPCEWSACPAGPSDTFAGGERSCIARSKLEAEHHENLLVG